MDKSRYREIEIEEPEGGAWGYSADTGEENVSNWMESCGFSQEKAQAIKEKYKRVAVLKGVGVDEAHRNKGIGSFLLESFIAEAEIQGCEAALLEADTGEDNPFDLVAWYKGYGFEIIEREERHPLMALDLN